MPQESMHPRPKSIKPPDKNNPECQQGFWPKPGICFQYISGCPKNSPKFKRGEQPDLSQCKSCIEKFELEEELPADKELAS